MKVSSVSCSKKIFYAAAKICTVTAAFAAATFSVSAASASLGSGGTMTISSASGLGGATLSETSFGGDATKASNVDVRTAVLSLIGGLGSQAQLDAAINTAVSTPGSGAEYLPVLAINGNISFAIPIKPTDDSSDITQRLRIAGGKAGAISVYDGKSLTIANNKNTTSGLGDFANGGALFVDAGGIVTLGARGVGYTTSDSSHSGAILFTNNSAGQGGAISNWSGTVALANATFRRNDASYGGALYNHGINGAASLYNVTFDGNSANYGGAINNEGGVSAVNTLFTSNSASSGGAIYNLGGTATLSNVTFTTNAATDTGGAIYNSGGTVNLTDATFTRNTSVHAGAIYSSGGTTTLTTSTGNATLFSGNLAGMASSSIYVETSGTLALHNAGTLDMRDAMGGQAANGRTIAITHDGTGIWKLAGNNVFTQSGTGSNSVAIREGTLYLYKAGEVANANALNLSAVVTDGTLSLAGSGSSFSLGSTGKTATLVANGTNAISAANINLNNSTITVNDGATLALDGNIAVAGKVVVNGTGTLNVAALNIGNAATLGGSGNIAGNIVIGSGGTLAPGNSIGTLAVSGNVTISNGGTFLLELNNDGGAQLSDRIKLGVGNVFTFEADAQLQAVNMGVASLEGIYLVVDGGAIAAQTVFTDANYTYTFRTDGTLLVAATAIPEPSTYALVGAVGALALVALRRRK